jgi:hypothetical protein
VRRPDPLHAAQADPSRLGERPAANRHPEWERPARFTQLGIPRFEEPVNGPPEPASELRGLLPRKGGALSAPDATQQAVGSEPLPFRAPFSSCPGSSHGCPVDASAAHFGQFSALGVHYFRHARARPGHPRLHSSSLKDVDGRDEPGHDDQRR